MRRVVTSAPDPVYRPTPEEQNPIAQQQNDRLSEKQSEPKVPNQITVNWN